MSHRVNERTYVPYDIPLGNGERARLVLPHDLSETEAERICGTIRALAFTDEQLAAAAAERDAVAESKRRAASSLGALIGDWAAAGQEATP